MWKDFEFECSSLARRPLASVPARPSTAVIAVAAEAVVETAVVAA